MVGLMVLFDRAGLDRRLFVLRDWRVVVCESAAGCRFGWFWS